MVTTLARIFAPLAKLYRVAETLPAVMLPVVLIVLLPYAARNVATLALLYVLPAVTVDNMFTPLANR